MAVGVPPRTIPLNTMVGLLILASGVCVVYSAPVAQTNRPVDLLLSYRISERRRQTDQLLYGTFSPIGRDDELSSANVVHVSDKYFSLSLPASLLCMQRRFN